MFENFLERKKKEKSQENGLLAENDKIKQSKRTGQKKTREEIGKGNQIQP